VSVSREISRTVRARAEGRCQYCLMHESLQGASFHIEHIIPQSSGGISDLGNLVLAYPGCNLNKGARTTAIVPKTSKTVPLFHPLRQKWSEHFRFDGYEIIGLTDEGCATVEALGLNHWRRQRIRQVEEAFGLFPPQF